LHGNMCEWCADPWEANYDRWKPGHRHDVAKAPDRGDLDAPRAIRGGSWDSIAFVARSACRLRRVPGLRDVVLGFRLVRLPPDP